MCSCEEAIQLMNKQLDEALDAREQAMLSEHLDQCEECRKIIDAYQDLQDGLLSLEKDPPENFAKGVMYRISRDTAPKKRLPFGRISVLSAAAALLLLLVGSGVLKNLHYNSNEFADSNASADQARPGTPAQAGGADAGLQYAYLSAKPSEAASDEIAEESLLTADTPALGNMEADQVTVSESVNQEYPKEAPEAEPEAVYESINDNKTRESASEDLEDSIFNLPEAEEAEDFALILRVTIHVGSPEEMFPNAELHESEEGLWLVTTLEEADAFSKDPPEGCEVEILSHTLNSKDNGEQTAKVIFAP